MTGICFRARSTFKRVVTPKELMASLPVVEYKGDAGLRCVESFHSAVDAVLAPELAAFDAVLGVGVGDNLAAVGAADDLNPAHLVVGLVDLMLLSLQVAQV